MLETIKKPVTYELPMSRMYLDDVRELYRLIEKKGRISQCVLGDYKIVKIEDFDDTVLTRKDNVTNLILESTDSGISIMLSAKRAEITLVDGEDDELLGIKEKVRIIMKRNGTAISEMPGGFGTWMAAYMISAFGLLFYFKASQVDPVNYVPTISLVILFIVSIIRLRSLSRYYSVIYLTDSFKHVSIFKRNKNELFVGSILSIITGVVGFVLGLLVN